MSTTQARRRVVPETYVQLLFEYLGSQGRDPEQLLNAAWPTPDPSGLGGIDEPAWSDMLDQAEQALNDPYLALNLGKTISSRHLGVMGAVFLSCGSLAEALQRLERYQRLIFDTVPMIARPVGDAVELVWDTHENRTSRLVDEVGLAVLVQFCRNITRVPIHPLGMDFTHLGPADVAPYEQHFGCPVHFRQKELVLKVSRQLLNAPLKTSDPGLARVLDLHAEQRLAQLPSHNDVVMAVRKAIASSLHQGEPSIELIAQQMACHPRTLQRQLKQANTTFRDELNTVRHQLAESHLRDQRLQIVDVAMLLGFSEHSAFTRSFKKWSGQTPHEFRSKLPC